MRSRAVSMILIASAAACAPSAPAAGPSPRGEAPPVRALLGERDRLALNSEQVVALDSISREADVTDRAVGRRLGIIKGGLVPRPGPGKQPHRAPALVAGSHGAAMQAVEQLLRPEQRERLCALQAARRGKAALRQDKRALAGHAASSPRARERETREWPWCAPDASRSRTARSQR